MEPADRDRLLRAHDQFLTDAAKLLNGVQIEVSGKPGQVVVFALTAKVIQLGCALQALLEAGYGIESMPIARSMLSGMAHQVALVDADTDGRALAFMLDAQAHRERLLGRARTYELLDEATIERLRRESREAQAQALASFERSGVTPKWLADPPSARTWHGLNTERDLFEKMKMKHIYELDYAWLSDTTHVNIGAIDREITDAFAEQIGFGPRGDIPTEVLLASSTAIAEVLAQLSGLLGLEKRDEIIRLRDQFRAVAL